MAYTSTSNASLPKPTYQNVIHDDMDLLKAQYASSMDILDSILKGVTGVENIATDATVVNTNGKRIVRLYVTSLDASIATIVGQKTYVPFTLVGAGSNASTANHLIIDSALYLLTANWNPGFSVGCNLTLVWDGSKFIELARSQP